MERVFVNFTNHPSNRRSEEQKEELVNSLMQQIRYLEKEDPEGEIKIFITRI